MSKRVVPQRFFEYKALFEGAMAQIEQAPAIEGLLKIQYDNFALCLKHVNRIIKTVENDEPLISEWYGNS